MITVRLAVQQSLDLIRVFQTPGLPTRIGQQVPLRFDLGPFEELHIGRCMITNSHERSLFAVEGNMPILRGKEFLPETAARTPLVSDS